MKNIDVAVLYPTKYTEYVLINDIMITEFKNLTGL